MPRYSPHSEETKRKISEANRGRKFTKEHIRKLSESHKGYKLLETTKEKLRIASTGRWHTEETKRKISKSHMGMRPSEETRKKLVESHKGFCPTQQTREKHRVRMTGEKNPMWKGGSKASRRRGYEKEKRDEKYVVSSRIRASINSSIRKGAKNHRHWEDLVGYTLEQLKTRLISTLSKNYSWQDVLDAKLEIDHIVPISVFNFSTPEHLDFKRCWALSNLQLLPRCENASKHNKLKEPFQPCLGLEIL